MSDEVLSVIKDWWAALGAGVAYIMWLVKLEGKANSNSKDISRLERDLKAHGDRTERMFEEIRSDIKTLLGKVNK